MTTAILVAGLLLTLLIAAAMIWPNWRLPGLAFAILAVPGNVDNILPQMALDPHLLADNTAPVVSVIDLLIWWGLGLSIREGRLKSLGRLEMWMVLACVGFWMLAAAASAVNLAQGVNLGAVLRGVAMLGRVPALVALAFALRTHLRDLYRVGIALCGGLAALLADGLYTSTVTGATRFTAATFGRNGFSIALMVCVLLVVGLALETFHRKPAGRARALTLLFFALASAGLFAAIETGTRISILAVIPASLVALVLNRSWWSRRGVAGLGLIVAGAVLISAAATLWTPQGGRAMSIVTDPGETIDIVTNPGGQPLYSPVRTRTHWWGQALQMIRDDPWTGVGPYQWNFLRYETDPGAAPVVADPHNTYLQMAAEYGLPTTIAYGLILTVALLGIVSTAWRATSPARSSWITTTLVAAVLMIPATELTNSHFFNVRLGALTWTLLGSALAMTLIPFTEKRGASERLAHPELPSLNRTGEAGAEPGS